MSGEGTRICPHCGTDRYAAERADRMKVRRDYLEREVERLARANGLLTFQLKDARAWAHEQHAALQRKLVKQARVIRRLERRLLNRGEQPHADATLAESSPVSDIPEVHVP